MEQLMPDEEFALSCFEHYHQEHLKAYKSWLKLQIETEKERIDKLPHTVQMLSKINTLSWVLRVIEG